MAIPETLKELDSFIDVIMAEVLWRLRTEARQGGRARSAKDCPRGTTS